MKPSSKKPRRRRPTRHDLLVVIARLQELVGNARSAYENDLDSGRAHKVLSNLRRAETLCYEAAELDPPVKMAGPWSGHGQ